MRYQRSETVKQATGRDWPEWFELLDAAGARTMTHREATGWLHEQGLLAGMWCQTVVTTYEQEIGRRVVGQTCDGDWNAGARRVLRLTPDEAFAAWCGALAGRRDFAGVPFAGEPTVRTSDKFRYWRVTLADGSRIDVSVYRNPRGEVSLGVTHKKLRDQAARDAWKTYWKDHLAGLGGSTAP